MHDLWAALCLVAVLEGLILFVAPGGWKRAAAQLVAMPDARLRGYGAMFLALGLIALYFVRSG